MNLALYALAALAEIAGCFAIWVWWRGASVWWLVPGALALAGFALALALTPPAHAGRSFAAYGGVYIAASLVWLWAVEGARPDRFDLLGAGLALAGAAVILLAPRATLKALRTAFLSPLGLWPNRLRDGGFTPPNPRGVFPPR